MISSTKTLKEHIKLWGTNAGIARAIALMGAVVYLAYCFHFANTQRATIDEGLFLYKGYLFAADSYHPFQDYGLRTEYGPLSYLIPGYIQLWFGPGLRTGRIFAIIVGVLALLGIWVTARRVAGPGWAAAAVWAIALNPALIRFYSIGISQGLVTCLLMWMLFFSLGKDRSAWQTSLSAVLAGLILLIRQNMAPVLPILLVYIFWQFGRKQGLISTLAGAIIVVAGHIVFWPGILVMWAPFLPAILTPFLNSWRLPEGVTPALNFLPNWSARLHTILEGFRFHFISLVGSIVGLVLWPARKTWKSEEQFRSGTFLAVLFFSLLGLHIWAGLGFGGINFGNAFTINPYLAFFNYSGLLLTISVFSNYQKQLSSTKQIVLSWLVILISTVIGYGGFLSTSEFLLNVRIPRIWSIFSTGKILPGYVPLWDYLANKFGIMYETSRRLIPLISGILVGLLVLLIGLAIWSFLRRKKLFQFVSFGAISVSVFMVAGLVFSPSIALGGGFNQWDCKGNIIDTYEQAGKYLAGVIPPGSRVYWEGGNAVAALLYVPGIKIFPQQVDWKWNYMLDGDPATLSRLNFWNLDLAEQWLEDADVILVQDGYQQSVTQSALDFSGFESVGKTSQRMNCTRDSFLMVYGRRR